MEYLIENPTLPHGEDFIRCLHRRFGARAVCFYTSPNLIPTSPEKHPELFSKDYVAANYLVEPDALPAFTEHLRRHHTISAVIPHGEMLVLNAITLAESLGLDWVQPAIMRRFRDKFALKAHLRATDPGLRINHAELVSSPAEALACVRRHRLAAFVLKPNDGVANISIGIFSSDDPLSLIEDYWQRTGARTVLLEEFVNGREYYCNGQVDAEGNITIIDIGRSHYTESDRREIVRLRNDQVHSAQPEFIQIADYCRRMIAASGLRRSPFHAELRADESGPCLIECAARIIGGNWAQLSQLMHGRPFDMIDLAAHYYVSSAPYGPDGINWPHYDATLLVKIRGVSTRPEKIRQLEGVKETEQLPQFMHWNLKPKIGQRLVMTGTLQSSPYALMLRCHTLAEVDALEQKIRGLIRWNTRPPSLVEKAGYYSRQVSGFIRWKLRAIKGVSQRMRIARIS